MFSLLFGAVSFYKLLLSVHLLQLLLDCFGEPLIWIWALDAWLTQLNSGIHILALSKISNFFPFWDPALWNFKFQIFPLSNLNFPLPKFQILNSHLPEFQILNPKFEFYPLWFYSSPAFWFFPAASMHPQAWILPSNSLLSLLAGSSWFLMKSAWMPSNYYIKRCCPDSFCSVVSGLVFLLGSLNLIFLIAYLLLLGISLWFRNEECSDA